MTRKRKTIIIVSIVGAVVATITLLVIVGIFLFGVFVTVAIGGEDSGTPSKVEYHTADDLYSITNIRFPEVELADSSYYDSFSYQGTTEKFVLKNREEMSAVIAEIQDKLSPDSIYWTVTDSTYRYYFYPEEPINRPEGSGWRLTEDGTPDWDGSFIEMIVPQQGDTITLKYGWCR